MDFWKKAWKVRCAPPSEYRTDLHNGWSATFLSVCAGESQAGSPIGSALVIGNEENVRIAFILLTLHAIPSDQTSPVSTVIWLKISNNAKLSTPSSCLNQLCNETPVFRQSTFNKRLKKLIKFSQMQMKSLQTSEVCSSLLRFYYIPQWHVLCLPDMHAWNS